ncbi:thioredoxin family protein [Neorhodopirellula pilleata]|uniref:Thiol:disulfide interchange protein DsbD n=1 Tax=Neorhodopirellula pilleata TaxID=2714738 RepID=A0A5C6ABQ6_9BACT|nr:thioredoxin family protein [Neorhodopirellula pilleata]TWT96501.1 Thiol:disulfide interchange protein DsbD [Neorhodopirellula pilleata]
MNLIQQGFGVGVVLAVIAIGQCGRSWAEMGDFSETRSAVAATGLTNSTAGDASPLAATEELKWFDTLESGWKAARDTGRPMVIFITSDHCQYCDVMKKNTLCEPSVRDRLLKRFIPIRLRPDSNAQVLSRVEVTAYPTTLVAHPRGKVLAHRIGYQPVEQFHEFLSEAAPTETPTTATIDPMSAGVVR